MNITKTSELLNSLLSQTNKKSEKKVYNCFIRTLSSLKKKNLTENQSQKIQEKLNEFKTFLKKEFSFTTEKYYTELGVIYGMSFGTGIGLSIGVAIDLKIGASMELAIGIGVGMVFGMMYGAKKDAEAKRLGRVI